ncbi:hypothetical protein ABID58_006349 [Bradyrhizobium sp. S3.2.6]|uniref:hypothetical protein n=1 Tax=Bradyrhizobium sp. S3.2.6 TaxID=3156428 RepID=UPI003398CE82
MSEQSAKIETICECIDHCFAFEIFIKDFARHADPDDMAWGLHRSVELVSDATRLQSFLALRKVDDFLRAEKKGKDNLIASDLGIDAKSVLGDVGETFLTPDEREMINKGVAHLTENLTLDPETEVGLEAIIKRSMPVFSRLVAALRKVDSNQEAAHSLGETEAVIKSGDALSQSTGAPAAV